MQKMRKWVNTWLGACVGGTAGLLFMAAVTVGHAAAEPKKGKAVEQPAQGQQLCPATPGAEACKVVLDCPPIKSPGKTTCEAIIDCPGPKEPVKTKKKTKSE
ncbi:MAG: hypothetical protein WC600_06420 [Desulfobaccales bacterium]